MGDWRADLDNAPKDRTQVLLGCANEPKWVAEGYFDPNDDGWYPAQVDSSDPWGDKIYPTHWMPMPNPPGLATVQKDQP